MITGAWKGVIHRYLTSREHPKIILGATGAHISLLEKHGTCWSLGFLMTWMLQASPGLCVVPEVTEPASQAPRTGTGQGTQAWPCSLGLPVRPLSCPELSVWPLLPRSVAATNMQQAPQTRTCPVTLRRPRHLSLTVALGRERCQRSHFTDEETEARGGEPTR